MVLINKILIVGSFPQKNKDIFGGIAQSCRILLKSDSFSKYEIIKIDSSQKINPKPSILTRTFLGFRRVIQLIISLIIDRPKLTLIFCSDGYSAIEKGLMILISKVFNVKSIIFPRAGNLINQTKRSLFFNKVISVMFNMADIFLCQGKAWSNYANNNLKIDKKKIKEISNWTATDNLIKIGSRRKVLKTPPQLNILFVGWLEKEKGIKEILRVLTILKNKHFSFKITFVGNGKMRTQIELFARANSIQNKVFVTGWLDSKKIIRHYKENDVFILPSWHEGMPNSLIEALASGLPSIVTSVGVIPDYLKDNLTAMIIPPKDFKALAEAIISLKDNYELRKKLSKNGFLLAKRLFLTKISLNKLSLIIDEQINKEYVKG